MKRNRSESETEMNEQERERGARERQIRVMVAMNERAKERVAESNLISSSLRAPTFLRSLLAPASASDQPTPIDDEGDIETKEGEEGNVTDMKSFMLMPPYLRLFQNPSKLPAGRKAINFGKSLGPGLGRNETKYSSSLGTALPTNFPTALANLVQSLHAEEIGTPREKCFFETNQNESDNNCLKNVENLRTEVMAQGVANFNNVECAIYCLLTNLPYYFDAKKVAYEEDEEEEEEEEEEEGVEFHLVVSILNAGVVSGGSNGTVRVYISYDEKQGKHIAEVRQPPELYKPALRSFVSIEDVIDLILYYGKRKMLVFNMFLDEDWEITDFTDIKKSPNPIWNIFNGSDRDLFTTIPALNS